MSLNGFLKPLILGSLCTSGVCPPSNQEGIPAPALCHSPLLPLPEVFPLPELSPLPLWILGDFRPLLLLSVYPNIVDIFW